MIKAVRIAIQHCALINRKLEFLTHYVGSTIIITGIMTLTEFESIYAVDSLMTILRHPQAQALDAQLRGETKYGTLNCILS